MTENDMGKLLEEKVKTIYYRASIFNMPKMNRQY